MTAQLITETFAACLILAIVFMGTFFLCYLIGCTLIDIFEGHRSKKGKEK